MNHLGMKVCSNAKPHKVLNQNRIIFDANTCGSNQCYECITNIFHSSLTSQEGQEIQDKLALDCGCLFQREIILHFLNQQCFNSMNDQPDYLELRSNKIIMRHPVKKFVSKKKWQEKVENFSNQQQKNPKEAMVHQQSKDCRKQRQHDQFFPVQKVHLNIIIPEQSDTKLCSRCQFTIEANCALTYHFGNNITQPSYLCLDCYIWKQWADNSKNFFQRYPSHMLQVNPDIKNRRPIKNRLSPIAFNKNQDKPEQPQSLSASKENESKDNQ